jgi:hypothetical protein
MNEALRSTPRPDELTREIVRLERKMAREEAHMNRITEEFWENGGVCCPGCGVPGYSELQRRQEHREQWLQMLREKAAKKGGTI